MKETKNILLVGVGGQGTILVSRLLTQGLIKAGYDVKMSEIHGMAQRGGSVSTQVRYGNKVHSPIIGRGQADIILAFEKMEAVRYVEFLKPGALAVINDYEIVPMSVASGFVDYPEGTMEIMEANFRVIKLDAAKIAIKLGNLRCMNVVLLGAMVRAVGLDNIDWEQVLFEQLDPKILDLNLKAFNAYK